MSGYIIHVGHLPAGALLAILDGEATSQEAAAHISGCGVCEANLKAIGDAAHRVRASLPPVSIPPLTMPRVPRRARSGWVTYSGVAAATLLLLASAATATPVRNWIVRHLSPETPPATAPTSVPRDLSPAGMTASFEPTDTLLMVIIAKVQRTGVVQLVAAPGDRISVQALAGAAEEELFVLPGRLRILNSDSSGADYRIAVPQTVRAVSVTVAGGRPTLVPVVPNLNRRIPVK